LNLGGFAARGGNGSNKRLSKPLGILSCRFKDRC
jgi:hypothetical protein